MNENYLDNLPLKVVTNEYDVKYLDYNYHPQQTVVDQYVKDYHITTTMPDGTPVHDLCLNCQISQCEKYAGSPYWQVRKKSSRLYKGQSLTSKVKAELRYAQKVRLLERHGKWCLIEAEVIEGRCMEAPDLHKVLHVESRELLEDKKCADCGGYIDIIVEKQEGWILWDDIAFFKCPCTFYPSEIQLPPKLKIRLSLEEQEQLMSLLDPLKWSETQLGLKPRINQKPLLMCTNRNMVNRMGRRCGKSWGEMIRIAWKGLTTQVADGVYPDGTPKTRGIKVIIATPFLAQIQLLFGILDKFCNRNKEILKSRERFVKTPVYHMEFSNGFEVIGFTTGTQSKQEGSTIRGQGADILLLDEIEEMDTDSILGAVKPIMTETPDVELLVSSTPKGKREFFFEQCTQNERCREFYFPSTILANWDRVKDEAEADGTHEHFLQEYMALFSVQATGVFQPVFVASAETDYEYNAARPYLVNSNNESTAVPVNIPRDDWVYSIGVDWNDKAGTEIYVTGLDPIFKNIWGVDSVNVPKQEWTQLAAMEALLAVNRKWRAKYIIVDRGYGQVQIDLLQKHARDTLARTPSSPDALLVHSLHAYDFSSNVQYRNLVTKQIEKAPAKPFLVENAKSLFEDRMVHYPASDPYLSKQLLNYIVANISVTGRPIYGMNSEKVGDHRLDALMLSLVAYKLYHSDFAMNRAMSTSIGYAAGLERGQGMASSTVHEGDREYKEFMGNVPRDQLGNPVVGITAIRLRYDPGYVEMKAAEKKQHGNVPSRTDKIEKSKDDVPDYRYGFGSDTEWKHKKPSLRIKRLRSGKPSRKTF